MSEQANEGQGQESGQGATGTGQESTGQQGQQGGQTGQESGQGQGQESGGFDLSKIEDPNLRAFLEHQQKDTAEARREAAQYRTQLRETQQTLQQMQRQGETEAQRQERERAEADQERERLREENRMLKVTGVVAEKATAAKAFSPTAVLNMIKGSIEYDADGRPTNVDTLIADLKRTDPYMFQRSRVATDASAGGSGGSPAPSMNDRIRQAAGRGRVQED